MRSHRAAKSLPRAATRRRQRARMQARRIQSPWAKRSSSSSKPTRCEGKGRSSGSLLPVVPVTLEPRYFYQLPSNAQRSAQTLNRRDTACLALRHIQVAIGTVLSESSKCPRRTWSSRSCPDPISFSLLATSSKAWGGYSVDREYRL